jgi:hypothetical protein
VIGIGIERGGAREAEAGAGIGIGIGRGAEAVAVGESRGGTKRLDSKGFVRLVTIMIDLGCWPTANMALGDDNDQIIDDLFQPFSVDSGHSRSFNLGCFNGLLDKPPSPK